MFISKPCPQVPHVHASFEHFRSDDSSTSYKQEMINSEGGKWVCSAFPFLEAIKIPTVLLSKRVHLWHAWASQLNAEMTGNEIFCSWQEVKEKCLLKSKCSSDRNSGSLGAGKGSCLWIRILSLYLNLSSFPPLVFLHGYKKFRCWFPKQLNNCT